MRPAAALVCFGVLPALSAIAIACGSSGAPLEPGSDASTMEGDTGTPDGATVVMDTRDAAIDGAPALRDYPIKHVVVIVKENHTFDNYFGSFPGAEGQTICHDANGAFPCPHAKLTPDRDLCHEHECAIQDWNGGKMDGWSTVNNGENKDRMAFQQYHEEDIPNYWAYAKSFVLADHFHSNMLGPSFPGHLFFLAAQAGWSTGNPPINVTFPYWGCDQANDKTVGILDHGTCSQKSVRPCFKIPSVPDVLPAGTDWKFYGTTVYDDPFKNEIWSMFDAVDSVRNGPTWSHVVNDSQFDADIKAKKLPAVSWLVPQNFTSEHPSIKVAGQTVGINVCDGENWTVKHLNTLMQSDYWKDTAVLISMDDFGGWYDHVPPPRQYGCNRDAPYGLGFRLPLIIISPYARAHTVFHEVSEQASIPHFIEKIFHAEKTLSDLDPAAQDGQANDLLNAFDFNQAPLKPLVLQERACP